MTAGSYRPPQHRSPLILPEFVEPKPGRWKSYECDITRSSVSTAERVINVPKAYTDAQQKARLHELMHVKESPSPWQEDGDWPRQFADVTRIATVEKGVTPDANAVVQISKMLEENRIDWLLWDDRGIDVRSSREVLDWSLWPDPDTVLEALCLCLQLAWTVWASRGLGKGIKNLPPPRSPDPATGECFDKHWKFLVDEKRDLSIAMIRGCLAMYENPTNLRRNEVAAELCTFFPAKIEEEKPMAPPIKAAEKAAIEEAKQEEQRRHDYQEAQETGVGAGVIQVGKIEYHDHTLSVRRQSMRIARRRTPVSQGTDFRYMHRYLLDKSIFSQRTLTEGGLMIDGSGSMRWSNDDLLLVMAVLPAITAGIYSGFGDGWGHWSTRPVYARICTLARNGKFAKFNRLDTGANDGNDCDYEALQLLATWPKPRLWLSDGLVCGGRYGQKTGTRFDRVGFYSTDGLLMDMCDAVMKRYEIYRVPDLETLHRLLKRQRVTLYRSCSSLGTTGRYGDRVYWPEKYHAQPVTFTL